MIIVPTLFVYTVKCMSAWFFIMLLSWTAFIAVDLKMLALLIGYKYMNFHGMKRSWVVICYRKLKFIGFITCLSIFFHSRWGQNICFLIFLYPLYLFYDLVHLRPIFIHIFNVKMKLQYYFVHVSLKVSICGRILFLSKPYVNKLT